MQTPKETPTVLFGKDTAHMKGEVIQAILNLQQTNDPNWLKIKEWISKEQQHHIVQAAFAIGQPDSVKSAYQGMALIVSAIAFYFEEPKIALQQAAQKAAKQAPPTGPVIP